MNFIRKIFFDRLSFLLVVYSLLFLLLLYKLYSLQIIEGAKYNDIVKRTTTKTISISSPRGEIYDKYGVPLAVNKTVFNLHIDPSISLNSTDLNNVLYKTILLLESNNEQIIFNMPITFEEPFTFKGSTSTQLRFKKDLNLFSRPQYVDDVDYNDYLLSFDIDDTLNALFNKFSINDEYPLSYKIKIASLRYSMYLQMFSRFNSIVISYDVSPETISVIEEQKDTFSNIIIDISQLRDYPLDEPLSHILGYTGIISNEELEELDGYHLNEIVGKSALEKFYESDLRGINGTEQITITPFGKRVSTVNAVPPLKGNDITLVLDSKLQIDAYNILEDVLREAIINKITKTNSREKQITMDDFFTSIVSGSNIDFNKIINAPKGTISYEINTLLLEDKQLQLDAIEDLDERANAKNTISYFDILPRLVSTKVITHYDILLLLIEQEIITANDDLINNIKNKTITPLTVVVNKLSTKEITPQMTNLDPSTASVVVVDVNTGDIITAASYPSYNNNQFANQINTAYLNKIYNDPTRPVIYRAFSERRAPGSTFKMITGVAGIESNYITPFTRIFDNIVFKKAGFPYAKSWSKYSLGNLNVSDALEQSANYFFYETAYRMGNASTGNSLNSINILNDYMIQFGLNDPTGAEIDEYVSNTNFEYVISSPQYKADLARANYSEPTNSQLNWYDGDTIRTAIGQSVNNYSAATMAKYIATLANGGKRYSLHFLDSIKSSSGEIVSEYMPILEHDMNLKQSTLDAIHKGMYLVTNGSRGTAKNIFGNFPITVAGKTGTAEQEIAKRANHTSFAAFAPYDNPEVAIYVIVPYGTTYTMGSPSVTIAKRVLMSYFGFDVEQTYRSNVNSFTK